MGVICINCGFENPVGNSICDKCGQPIKHSISENEIVDSFKEESSFFQNDELVHHAKISEPIGVRYNLIKKKCQIRESIIWDVKDTVTDESLSLVLLENYTKRRYFLDEYNFLTRLHLPGVLYPHIYAEDGDKCFYITDWINDVLAAYCGKVDFNIAEMVFAKIASLLNILHSKKIILGNLSTETILVGKDHIPYISPSAFLSIRYDSITYAGGTMSFRMPNLAPEFYTANGIKEFPSQAGDIWALGALMYELITKNKPFGENGGSDQHNGVCHNPYFNFYSTTELDIVRLRRLQYLVARCLEQDPSNRPTSRFIAECLSLRVVKSQRQNNLYAIVHPLIGVIYTIEAEKITPFTAHYVPGPGPLPPISAHFMGVRYEIGDECGYLKLEDNGQIVKYACTSKEEYNRRCRYT